MYRRNTKPNITVRLTNECREGCNECAQFTFVLERFTMITVAKEEIKIEDLIDSIILKKGKPKNMTIHKGYRVYLRDEPLDCSFYITVGHDGYLKCSNLPLRLESRSVTFVCLISNATCLIV